MTDKTWIKVKRGLVVDPKHRDAMGIRIWLYLYMLDEADWETGTIPKWKDKEVAEALGMELRTLREQRRGLETADYITCYTKRSWQTIVIHNYTNPREYSDSTKNPVGLHKDVTQGISKYGTLPIIPHLNNIPEGDEPKKITSGELSDLRKHFSFVSRIPEPKWSELDKKARGKYGAWWNAPLKNMWISCHGDLEITKQTITVTISKSDFNIYAPISIEKAYQKYINSNSNKEVMKDAADL